MTLPSSRLPEQGVEWNDSCRQGKHFKAGLEYDWLRSHAALEEHTIYCVTLFKLALGLNCIMH